MAHTLTFMCYLHILQFPDPWRRAKHSKRLIIQPQLIWTLCKHMTRGACVYLSSDCDQIAERMRSEFLKHGAEHFALSQSADELFPAETAASACGITANTFVKSYKATAPVSDEQQQQQQQKRAKTTNGTATTADAVSSSMDSAGTEWIKTNPLVGVAMECPAPVARFSRSPTPPPLPLTHRTAPCTGRALGAGAGLRGGLEARVAVRVCADRQRICCVGGAAAAAVRGSREGRSVCWR